MAVQKSRKSKAKSKTRRTKKLSFANVVTCPVTGEKSLNHHVNKSGLYKGKPVIANESNASE